MFPLSARVKQCKESPGPGITDDAKVRGNSNSSHRVKLHSHLDTMHASVELVIKLRVRWNRTMTPLAARSAACLHDACGKQMGSTIGELCLIEMLTTSGAQASGATCSQHMVSRSVDRLCPCESLMPAMVTHACMWPVVTVRAVHCCMSRASCVRA